MSPVGNAIFVQVIFIIIFARDLANLAAFRGFEGLVKKCGEL